MGNEEFLESMDFPSQEYGTQEKELDGDDEGFVESSSVQDLPKGRSGNYSVKDDLLRIVAWKKIGLDPAVGTELPKDTYWARVKEFYDLHKEDNQYERTSISLRHRWQTINNECQKWSACLYNVEVMNPSGTNEKDRVSGFMKIVLFFYFTSSYDSCSFTILPCSWIWLKICSREG